MHRLDELVTAAEAGSFFAHGKKVSTQEMLSLLLWLLWRWQILENGSWKEHPETQGRSRSETHSGIICAVLRCSRLSPLCLHRAQAEGTDAMADLPFCRLRAGADPAAPAG